MQDYIQTHNLMVEVFHTVNEHEWIVVHLYRSRSRGVVSGETMVAKLWQNSL